MGLQNPRWLHGVLFSDPFWLLRQGVEADKALAIIANDALNNIEEP